MVERFKTNNNKKKLTPFRSGKYVILRTVYNIYNTKYTMSKFDHSCVSNEVLDTMRCTLRSRVIWDAPCVKGFPKPPDTK